MWLGTLLNELPDSVTLGESELLRAVGACLNCPVPLCCRVPYPGPGAAATHDQSHVGRNGMHWADN